MCSSELDVDFIYEYFFSRSFKELQSFLDKKLFKCALFG